MMLWLINMNIDIGDTTLKEFFSNCGKDLSCNTKMIEHYIQYRRNKRSEKVKWTIVGGLSSHIVHIHFNYWKALLYAPYALKELIAVQ